MEKTKYTIVGIAPASVQKKFINIKEKLDIHSDETSIKNHVILKDTAHFAIKRTFYLPKNISENQIIKKIKELNNKKLTINCSDIGIFQNSAFGEIIYLKIDKNMNLWNIHKSIKNKIDPITETKNPEMENENYIPHLSVAYNVPKDVMLPLKSSIELEIPVKFSLKEIILLRDYDTKKDEREIIYIHKLR